MAAAARPLAPADAADIARTNAIGQIHVLMRAAGVPASIERIRAAVRCAPDAYLVAMPEQLADAIDWHRRHAPAELTDVFRRELEQLERDADAGQAPLTDDDIEAEIQAARAERRPEA